MNKMDFEKLKNAGFEWEKSIKKSGLSSFEAGAQSRQAEIEEITETLKTSADSEMYLFDELQKVKKERDELQKRIDDSLKILQEMKHNGAYRATYILKGQNND